MNNVRQRSKAGKRQPKCGYVLDFIGLADNHVFAMLPVEFLGELGVRGVVMLAAVSRLFATVVTPLSKGVAVGSVTGLVVFTK